MLKIKAIYDNPNSFDRYSVYVDEKQPNGLYDCLGLSSEPTAYNGFSQWTSGMLGKHNGKKVSFNSLPENIQEHIKFRLSNDI